MSNIISALRKAQEKQEEARIQPGTSKSSQFFQMNTALCVALITLSGAGLWSNARISAKLASSQDDTARILNELKGQHEKLNHLSVVIAGLEKTNGGQAQNIQALHNEFVLLSQNLVKAMAAQEETVKRMSLSNEQLRSFLKSYKSENQELSRRVDALQEIVSTLNADQ